MTQHVVVIYVAKFKQSYIVLFVTVVEFYFLIISLTDTIIRYSTSTTVLTTIIIISTVSE